MTAVMQAGARAIPIGRVSRADIRGFTAASRLPEPDIPVFGQFVKALVQRGDTDLIGLVYDICVQDDPFTRQLAVQARPDPVVALDLREQRGIPIEISVVAVGYRDRRGLSQGLPPQPPFALDEIVVCSDAEIVTFTRQLGYLRLLLGARDLPVDELIVASLQAAARARPPDEQERFLLDAGRELARSLGNDLARLEGILWRIQPQ